MKSVTQMIEETMRLTAYACAVAMQTQNEPATDDLIEAGYLFEAAHRASQNDAPRVADSLMADAQRALARGRAALCPQAVAVS